MIGHSSRRTVGVRIAIVVCAVLAIGVPFGFLAVGGLASGTPPNPALDALLQTTPTPVPTPVTAACGVTIAPTMTLAADTASLELTNGGAAVEVKGATVKWPEVNGNLVEMKLGTATVWRGPAEGGAATVFWDRTATIPVIKDGESLQLALRFSKGVTDGRYQLVLHLSRECYALFDSRLPVHNQPCFTTFDAFTVRRQTARLNVRNTTRERVAYDSVTVFWADEISSLESVRVDRGSGGRNLLPGPTARSPVEVPLSSAAVGLAPGASMTLELGFEGAAPLVNYTIIFRGDGCESVFSNAEPPTECPISQVGEIAVATSTAGVILQNPGPVAQPISRLWVDYPADNGNLIDVMVGDMSIANTSAEFWEEPGPPPASMTTGVELQADASLPPNSRSALTLAFADVALPTHYTIDLTYGDSCRFLTSTRSAEHEDCQVAVAGALQVDGNQVRLAIENTGSVPAEPMAIQVDWTPELNGSLLRVDVGDSVFWTGDRADGSLTVTHNTDEPVRVLQPGEMVDVAFTFSVPDEVGAVEEPYVFYVRFAEGCEVLYATGPDLAMPPVVEVQGFVETIPAEAFDGEWRVRVSSDRIWTLRVTPRTTVLPPGLSPVEGDIIEARALRLSSERYLGLQIRIHPDFQESIEISGVIEAVDPGPTPERIWVQGVEVDRTVETEVFGELIEGWLADVSGLLRVDGSIWARTITTTEPTSGIRQVDFEGVVERYDPLPSSPAESLWLVSGIRAIVNEHTTKHHGILPGTPPELDALVRLAGALQLDGSVQVHELWYDDGQEVYNQFRGIIRAVPVEDPQLLGTWIIEEEGAGTCNPDVDPDAEACVPILVTESTFIDISLDIPAIGAPVEVRVRQNPDGNWECQWLRVLVDEDAVDD